MTSVERFKGILVNSGVPREKLHTVTVELLGIVLEETAPLLRELILVHLTEMLEELDEAVNRMRSAIGALKEGA